MSEPTTELRWLREQRQRFIDRKHELETLRAALRVARYYVSKHDMRGHDLRVVDEALNPMLVAEYRSSPVSVNSPFGI